MVSEAPSSESVPLNYDSTNKLFYGSIFLGNPFLTPGAESLYGYLIYDTTVNYVAANSYTCAYTTSSAPKGYACDHYIY